MSHSTGGWCEASADGVKDISGPGSLVEERRLRIRLAELTTLTAFAFILCLRTVMRIQFHIALSYAQSEKSLCLAYALIPLPIDLFAEFNSGESGALVVTCEEIDQSTAN